MSGPAGRRILVVEDDESLREVVHQILEAEAYEVRVAGDGRQALEILPTWQPDLIVLDLMMPVMDGETFARAVADTPWRDVPLLVLSAVRDLDRRVAAMGATASLAKPFELDALVDRVEALLPPAR